MKSQTIAVVPYEIPKKRKTTRGAFRASEAAIATARRKYDAACAAVAVALTGKDLREFGAAARDGDLVASVLKLERALAVYVAVVVLKAPKKVLSLAIGSQPSRVRAYCNTIEAWREAPVIADALGRVEAALPGAF